MRCAFMVSPAAMSERTAFALFPRSIQTTPERDMNCPSRGDHCSSFFATMEALRGNILETGSRHMPQRDVV